MKKSANQVPVPQTRGDMENLLAQIAGIKRDEAAVKLNMDRQMAGIKAGHAVTLSTFTERLAPLVTAAETWATSNPAEFGKNKSIKFVHGTVGFRTSTPALALLNRKWSWEKVLAKLQQLGNWVFIRKKLEVDKDAIINAHGEVWSDETLAGFGVKVTQDESFFVETDLTTVEKREVAK